MARAASPQRQSALLDLDLALGLHRLGLLRRRDLQDALVEGRLHLGLVDRVGQLQRAFERAEAALGEVVGLALLLVLVLLLAPDGEQTVGEGDGHVPLLHAGQLGLDHDRLGIRAYIEVRHDQLGAGGAPEGVGPRAEPGPPWPVGFEALEHAVHLVAHRGKDIAGTRYRRVSGFGNLGLGHDVLRLAWGRGSGQLEPANWGAVRPRPQLCGIAPVEVKALVATSPESWLSAASSLE